MAKDPAFLFYPGDWLGGTMYMTHLEKGCYIDLLMLQFNKGKFTIAQAKHMLSTSFDLAWANIEDKFIFEDGLYWNERLQEEKEKRSKFSESRRNNAKSVKATPKNTESYAEHMPVHMEDENENENLDSKSITKKSVVKKNEPIYRSFKHLSLTISEYHILIEKKYSKEKIDDVLDAIENYKKNTTYVSLYLTALKWLKKDTSLETQKGKGQAILTEREKTQERLRQKYEQSTN